MLEEGKFKQVKRTTISQSIVHQLVDLIMSGTLKPGEKLPSEKVLQDTFGVGRSSLREAIRGLVVLGLVEIRVPEGTFITDSFGDFFTKHLALISRVSFENIGELVESRIAIEASLAELAALKATEEECERLSDVLAEMRRTFASNDNNAFLQSDLEFHTYIARMANNSFMLHVLNILRDITEEWIYKVIQMDNSKETAIAQHTEILEALKKNDSKLAEKFMKQHLRHVSDLLLEMESNK